MTGVRARRQQRRLTPNAPNLVGSTDEICLEVFDHSVAEYSAVRFFGTNGSRDPLSQAARLSQQFGLQNRRLFGDMEIEFQSQFDGNDLTISLCSGSKVGAIPLYSPTRGTADYGLVIKPRFPWSGIGPMLADMGWKVAPTPLKLPLLHRSERRVPPWVLSHMILSRLEAMLRGMTRRFETTSEIRTAPRGRVDWTIYAQRQMTRAQMQAVPCSFSDLRDDRTIKGAIRFALERQLRSLQSQVGQGAFVYRLIDLCMHLLFSVRDVPAMLPTQNIFQQWTQRPMRAEHFIEGVQAIEWTADERGLAGLSDLDGIPWMMSMDGFFEAFIETVLQTVARRTGAKLKSGRRRETVAPINWSPSFVGSQRSLVPDVWLEWRDTTMIVDAKYKRHWEELQHHKWSSADEAIREQHRNDLFQVLAYANLARTPRVISCLMFPCTPDRWKGLRESNRLIHKADVQSGGKNVQLWLTAVPMGVPIDKVASPIEEATRLALVGDQVR